jgi:hypothetical protein
MGINGQKRKNKQGPVPTLEESLPKKFKSDKSSKVKVKETNGKGISKKEKGKDQSVAEKPVVEFDSDEQEEGSGSEDVVMEDFSKTKASLFDDAEDLPEDEFNGMDEESEDLYLPPRPSLTVQRHFRRRRGLCIRHRRRRTRRP